MLSHIPASVEEEKVKFVLGEKNTHFNVLDYSYFSHGLDSNQFN